MTEKELEMMLAQKVPSEPRGNISLVLSPDITRNAMRLKKRRRDRIQNVLCCAAVLVFILAAVGLGLYLKNSEAPEAAMKTLLMSAGAGMGLVLLLSPALAWFSDEERKNEA